MENHVTFETAMALKAAGFPQPTGESGQFWWGKKSAGNSEPGSLCVLIGTDTGKLEFTPVDGVKNPNNRFFVFAPTAADILFELKEHDLTYWHPQEIYYVEDTRNGIQWTNENPAEAAASAYLELKQK